MDLNWSAEDLAFRDEVRAFLDANLTDDLRRAGRLMTSVYAEHDASMAWQAILHERGWAAPAWPVEYGGCDWTLPQHYIFSRECQLAGAPSLSPMGIRMVSHAIMKFGTKEQKDFFLPGILTGEVFFCQGYSEPEAGSDLAALSMSAVDDGDDLICTGSKIWTTHAGEANWIFALVRTSRGERRQQGITFVLIDMPTPGIEIRPLKTMTGASEFNEVSLKDVRVPKTQIVGARGQGWFVSNATLKHERGMMGNPAASAARLNSILELMKRETIDGDEMDRVLRGEKLEPQVKNDPDPQPPTASAPVLRTDEDNGQMDAFGQPSPRPA